MWDRRQSKIKLKDKVPKDSPQKIEKMSHIALVVPGNAVEVLLRRDYHLTDKTVDNVENIRSLEDDAIASIEKDKIHDQAKTSSWYLKTFEGRPNMQAT